MLAKCGGCGKARDDVLKCAIQIGGRQKWGLLCGTCRKPLEALSEGFKGRARGRRPDGPVIPADPAAIPLDRPPTKRAEIRLR